MALVYSTADGYREQTQQELAQQETDRLVAEEQALLDLLVPTRRNWESGI